jgi:hypothetical protein
VGLVGFLVLDYWIVDASITHFDGALAGFALFWVWLVGAWFLSVCVCSVVYRFVS